MLKWPLFQYIEQRKYIQLFKWYHLFHEEAKTEMLVFTVIYSFYYLLVCTIIAALLMYLNHCQNNTSDCCAINNQIIYHLECSEGSLRNMLTYLANVHLHYLRNASPEKYFGTMIVKGFFFWMRCIHIWWMYSFSSEIKCN